MSEELRQQVLTALNRNPPRGWKAQGVYEGDPNLGFNVDYVNAKGKHKSYSLTLIEGGVRISGGRSGPVDVMFE